MTLNHVIEKGKPRYKLSYKLLKEECGYDPLLNTFIYASFIKLKYFQSGIHHCVTDVGKWNFDSNFTSTLHIIKDNLDYCCINDNEKNNIKWSLRSIESN